MNEINAVMGSKSDQCHLAGRLVGRVVCRGRFSCCSVSGSQSPQTEHVGISVPKRQSSDITNLKRVGDMIQTVLGRVYDKRHAMPETDRHVNKPHPNLHESKPNLPCV